MQITPIKVEPVEAAPVLGADEPGQMPATVGLTPPLSKKKAVEEEDAAPLTSTDLLLELTESLQLFHTPDGESCASASEGGRVQTWKVYSDDFQRWIAHKYYGQFHKLPAPRAFQDTLRILEARAKFDGDLRPVHLRTAGYEDRVFLDLANENCEVIEIDSTGWRIAQQVPVHFYRPKRMGALPIPQPGGSLSDLRRYINAPDDDTFIPVVAWLVGALRPAGPYPLLCLQGEQGAAKSTLSRVLRTLLDPAMPALRNLSGEDRDLIIAANNNRILVFDNLSVLSPRISDALCRLATGGGFSTRKLYSSGDEMFFEAMRPVILNGIDSVVAREDLADRSLIVNLPAIPDGQRRTEELLWKEFEAARPLLLGAVCDAVSVALKNINHVSATNLPRMADFAKWIIAAEPALPWKTGDFMEVYLGARKHAIEVAIEGDSVASAIRELLVSKNSWQGTATDLLVELQALIPEQTRKSRSWPKSPITLANRVRRAATFLRTTGIDVRHHRAAGTGQRLIEIQLIPDPIGAGTAHLTPKVTKIQPDTAPEMSQLSELASLPVSPSRSSRLSAPPEHGELLIENL